MKLLNTCFILMLLLILGCNKPNPNPENLDPIYSSLVSEKKSAEQSLAAELKTLEENKQNYEKVKPQTGQNKYAMKRVYDSQARITKLEQQIKFLTIQIESRVSAVKKSYLAAFNKGLPWPNPDEYKEYQSHKRLLEAPRVWNPRERIEKSKLPQKPAAGGNQH